MKIELSGPAAVQAPVERAVERSTKQVTSAPTSAVAQDRTTLSDRSESASVASLARQALATPAIRQDKIDALRQSIASGEYKIDAGKIASALIAGESR